MIEIAGFNDLLIGKSKTGDSVLVDLNESQNIFICGGAASGKTTMLKRLVHDACRDYPYCVLHITSVDMLGCFDLRIPDCFTHPTYSYVGPNLFQDMIKMLDARVDLLKRSKSPDVPTTYWVVMDEIFFSFDLWGSLFGKLKGYRGYPVHFLIATQQSNFHYRRAFSKYGAVLKLESHTKAHLVNGKSSMEVLI